MTQRLSVRNSGGSVIVIWSVGYSFKVLKCFITAEHCSTVECHLVGCTSLYECVQAFCFLLHFAFYSTFFYSVSASICSFSFRFPVCFSLGLSTTSSSDYLDDFHLTLVNNAPFFKSVCSSAHPTLSTWYIGSVSSYTCWLERLDLKFPCIYFRTYLHPTTGLLNVSDDDICPSNFVTT